MPQTSNTPEEIKQLAHWWGLQVKAKAGSELSNEDLLNFETVLSVTLAEGVGDKFSVSLFYRDAVPSVLLRAARKSKLGAIKPYLQPCLFSRAQPGQVLVQVGDKAQLKNIFTV